MNKHLSPCVQETLIHRKVTLPLSFVVPFHKQRGNEVFTVCSNIDVLSNWKYLHEVRTCKWPQSAQKMDLLMRLCSKM